MLLIVSLLRSELYFNSAGVRSHVTGFGLVAVNDNAPAAKRLSVA